MISVERSERVGKNVKMYSLKKNLGISRCITRVMRRVHHLSQWLCMTGDVKLSSFNLPLKFALFNCRTPNVPALIRELPLGWRDEKQTSAALQFPFPLHPHLLPFSSSLLPLLSRMLYNFAAWFVNGAKRKILNDPN